MNDSRKTHSFTHTAPVTSVFYRLMIPLCLIVFLLVSGFSVALLLTYQHGKEQFIKQMMADVEGSLEVTIKRGATSLSALSELLLREPGLKTALQEQDRDQLQALFTPIFNKTLSKYSVTHLYFHQVDQAILLRIHKPEMQAGAIERATLANAEKSGQAWNVELDAGGTLSLRVVTPVYANDNLVGYMELAQEIYPFLQLLHTRLHVDMAVTVNKQLLQRELWEQSKQQAMNRYSWDRYDDRVLVYASRPYLATQLDALFEKGHVQRSNQIFRTKTADSRDLQIFSHPFQDTKKNTIADIFVFYDNTATQKAFTLLIYQIAAMATLLLGFLVALFTLLLRRTDRHISDQQSQLAENERLQRSILEALDHSGLYLMVVGAQYKIKYMSNGMMQDFGNLVGQTCYRAITGKNAPPASCPLSKVLETGLVLHHECTLPDKRSFSMIAVPYTDIDGTLCKLEIMRETTEQKKMEERQQALEKELQRSKKMEAIGLLAGGVAHDLNNILAGVVGYPEMILEDLPEESELRQPLLEIQDSGIRAAAVVADMLTLTRGAAIAKTSHDLHTLVQNHLQSLEYIELAARHPNITLYLELHAEQATILCSAIHISKTLYNLLSNAMEAMANDQGKVIISSENQIIDEERADTQVMQTGTWVVLSVRDTGPGMDEKHMDHIFEPFYTLKEMGRSGTGLGLSIVWNTMKDHNGKVEVENTGQGTCFRLFFPTCDTTGAPCEPENKEQNIRGNGEHILIIDDESQLRKLATKMLKNLGYTVDSVSSGEEALRFLKDQPVDLIILDMLMEPGMDGRQTYGEILNLHPGQKAIIASGFSESDDIRAVLHMGASGFTQKPYSITQLGLAVKNALSS